MTEIIEVTEALPPEDVFVACTHCENRSYYFAFLKTGQMLPYCLHGWNTVREKLKDLADTVVDRSYLLGRDR